MNALLFFILLIAVFSLLNCYWPLPETGADPDCPHCRGLGYDASGYTCTCIGEKK